jgi:hypothetical protein
MMGSDGMLEVGQPPRISAENPGPEMPIGPARILYLATLDLLPVPALRRFWQAHPLTQDGKTLSEAELYRALWGHLGTISADYCQTIWNDAEHFLNENGISGEQVIRNKIFRLNQQGMWKASHVLAWIKELLPQLYRDPNPMLTLLHILGRWSEGAFPGSWGGVPRHREVGGEQEAVSAWAPSRTFAHRFYYAVDLHSVPFHRSLPTYFGLPAYDEVRLIADCRSATDLLWDQPSSVEGDAFRINGRTVGRLVEFSRWAREEGLLFEIEVPDCTVVRMEESHHCARRRRVVLYEGCVYSAPLYLASFRFRSESPQGSYGRASDYLNQITADMLRSDEGDWGPFEDVHRSLLEAAETRLAFELVPDSEMLKLNGKTLMSGVPAKILWKILCSYVGGQSTFDYRTFKHDPTLFRDPKRTSFEVRLNRLREKLARDVPSLKLEKTREGEFSVSADCPVTLGDSGRVAIE